MAAILKLRRGTSTQLSGITLVESELFFNTTNKTIIVGDGSSTHTLVKIGANTGSIELTGNLNIGGNTVLTSITGSSLYITGDSKIDGNLRLGGNIFLGSGSDGDLINVNASLSGSLVPETDGVFDLGSIDFKYRNFYSVSASIDYVSLPGSGILSSSLQDFDTFSSSIESQLDSVYTFTQSADQRLTSIEIFTQSVDLRVDTLELSQSYFDNTYSGSVHTRLVNLEITGSDHESRIDVIETTFSSSVDLRLDDLESTGSSHEIRIIDLENTGSNQENRIDNLELSQSYFDITFSSSVDLRLDTLETTFSSSVDSRLDAVEFTSSNQESRLDTLETTFSSSVDSRLDVLEFFSSSEYQTDSSSFDLRLDTIETTFSSSVNQRLVKLETTGSDHELRLDEIETTFSSSVDSRIVSLNDYTESNDLRVNNLETTGSDHESRLDIIESTFSSSVDSRLDSIELYTSSLNNAISVNGTNLTVLGDLIVEGTTTSINTQELLIEDKLLAIASGSTTSGEANNAGFFISGANASILWNHSTQTLDFNTKVSSSIGFKGDGSQLENLQYTNVDFDGSGLVSGSSQISADQTEGWVADVKVQLDANTVISGSSQVNADSITNFDSNVKDKLNDDLVHSGSYLGTATTDQLDEGTRLYYTDLRVKAKLNAESVISGSSQLDGVFLKINGDNVVSGSSQITLEDVSGFTLFSSSVDSRLDVIDVLNLYTQSNDLRLNLIETFTESIDTRVVDLEATASNHENRVSLLETFSASLDNEFLNTNGDGVVSGSSQITIGGVDGFSAFSSSVNSRLDSVEEDQHTHTNKSNLDTINQNLSSSDSPEFVGLTLSNLPLKPTSNLLLQGVLYSSSGELVYSQFGDSIYYNVSSSISNGDPTVLGNAGAVKDYIDEQLLIIGAGDITSVIAGDGMSGGADSGPATLTLDTGSIHFIDGVNGVVQLGDGILSSSAQISAYGVFAELNGDGLVSSSLQITNGSGILSSSNETFAQFSASVALDFAGLSTDYNDLQNIPSGIVSSSQQISSYGVFAELNGDGLVSGSSQISFNGIVDKPSLVSGSSQIDIEQTTNFTTFSSSLDSRLDNQELFSSSINTTIKTKMNLDGVISGSSQVLAGSGIVSSSQQISSYNVFAELNGDNLVSSSAQISAYNTFLEINGDSVVSSSAQISAYNTFLEINGDGVVSGSDQLTGSLVDLSSDQTISGTKTFNDIVVNGTGSFAYITSVNGTAKIIGDSFIVVNTDTPTSRYAGLSVYDSGSTLSTASFYFDGQTNDWGYEYSSSAGVDYAVTIFGPEYSTKGNPTYLTSNTIPKAVDNHHLNDSNISDSGTLITLGSNVQVNGNISITGTVDGIDLQNFSSSVDGRLDTLEGTSNENPLTFNDTTTIDFTRVGDIITAKAIGGIVSSSAQISGYDVFLEKNGDGVVSGSSQITLSGDITGPANNTAIGTGVIVNADVNATAAIAHTKLNFAGSGIVSGSSQIDVTQTTNYSSINQYSDTKVKTKLNLDGVISGSTFASPSQGNLNAVINGNTQSIDLGLQTTDTVEFAKVGVGGAADATYELKVTGDVGATGDVVAYISSDRRLKDEITPIENSLQKINSIGGYSFVWNENQHIYKGKDYGVIAQEIEQILPELVETRENGYKAVKYDRIVSLLIEGIKELSKEVSELKEKIGK